MTPKEEFLQVSSNVEGFVTLMRGSASQIHQAFAGDDVLTAQFLRNVEEAAAAYRRAQELWASGQQTAALSDIKQTRYTVNEMRILIARAAAASGQRTWAEHLALSDTGRSLTGAVGDVVQGAGDALGAIGDKIGEAAGDAWGVVKVLAIVAVVAVGVAGVVYAVRASS